MEHSTTLLLSLPLELKREVKVLAKQEERALSAHIRYLLQEAVNKSKAKGVVT